MNIDNEQVIFSEDVEYRVYCGVSDNLCIKRFYKNHLKSRTHKNSIRKKVQLKKTFQRDSQH